MTIPLAGQWCMYARDRNFRSKQEFTLMATPSTPDTCFWNIRQVCAATAITSR